MDKIFEQAKDLHVVATMVYSNGEDGLAYADTECKKQFKLSELKEVFIKGALIKDITDGTLYQPISFIENVIVFLKGANAETSLVAATADDEE